MLNKVTKKTDGKLGFINPQLEVSFQGHITGRKWSQNERKCHHKVLESRTSMSAKMTTAIKRRGIYIHDRIGHMVALSYLIKMGKLACTKH